MNKSRPVWADRSNAQGYVSESVRQGFTGYEEDAETGLDYAQARYFSSPQGRFTAVDPLMASANPANPQTWNRYSYALNNPTRFTDPTGLITESDYDGTTEKEKQVKAAYEKMQEAASKPVITPEQLAGTQFYTTDFWGNRVNVSPEANKALIEATALMASNIFNALSVANSIEGNPVESRTEGVTLQMGDENVAQYSESITVRTTSEVIGVGQSHHFFRTLNK